VLGPRPSDSILSIRLSINSIAVVHQATGAAARARFTDTTLAGLARRRQPREAGRQQAVRQSEICRLVLALREAGRALKADRAELHAIVNDLTPGLTTGRDRPGQRRPGHRVVLPRRSLPQRRRVRQTRWASPIEASSEQTTRHRLNRVGDRALNKAIHVIANTRIRTDAATQAYVTRRSADGKSNHKIRRCIKRYITRQLYRALTAAMTPTSTAGA
jgi:hypothetical protein